MDIIIDSPLDLSASVAALRAAHDPKALFHSPDSVCDTGLDAHMMQPLAQSARKELTDMIQARMRVLETKLL